jgi:DNA-binding transcriptional regulator YiaG
MRSICADVDGLGLTVSRKVSTNRASEEQKRRTKPDPVPTPEQVRAARAALGISADELAEMSGIAKSTILRYERRAGRAYAETLQMLREALEARV